MYECKYVRQMQNAKGNEVTGKLFDFLQDYHTITQKKTHLLLHHIAERIRRFSLQQQL